MHIRTDIIIPIFIFFTLKRDTIVSVSKSYSPSRQGSGEDTQQ